MEVPKPAPDPSGDGGLTDREEVARLRAAHSAALQALQSSVRDTTRLTRLFTILGEPLPLEVLLDRVLATLSELFSSDVVVLLGHTLGAAELAPLGAIGIPEDQHHLSMSGAAGSHAAAALATGAPVLALDDPGVDPVLRGLDARSVVWIPVVGSQGPMAVLVLARCRPVPFARSDVDLLTAMAYRVGLVLERLRAEASLGEARERLLQSEKLAMAGRLAGLVAHEVNNPLASVLSSLQAVLGHLPALAEDGGAGLLDEVTEILTEALSAASRIGHLMDGFTLLASPQHPAPAERVDLNALVDACLDELGTEAAPPGLARAAPGSAPCVAWVEPTAVKTALLGLLRFLLAPGHRRAGPALPVSVRVEVQEGAPAVVLSDPTMVLSEEQRRSIFDPRLEEVETAHGRAVRLSLALAIGHQLLDRCGVVVSAVSPGPQGLEIRLRLPAAQPPP